MDIIKKFGDMVGKKSIRDPEKARKLLLTGYRLQEKRLQLFPDRKLPASGQHVARVVMQNIIKALAKPDDTALVSIFVPGELLTAAGITPYSVEAMSCFIAGTRCEQAFLAQTESEGFPETMCSYHRVFLGASMTGLVPKPKCTIYTNLACDGNMMTFPNLKQKYQIPGFYIDVPYEKNQDSISYVADQLRELKKFLEDVGGKKISEQSVQRAVANSNEAASYYSRQLALRKDHDPVTSLTNELYAIFMCHLLAGSEESLKYTKMLLEDVCQEAKRQELLPSKELIPAEQLFGRAQNKRNDQSVSFEDKAQLFLEAAGAYYNSKQTSTIMYKISVANYARLKGHGMYARFANLIGNDSTELIELQALRDSACSYYVEALEIFNTLGEKDNLRELLLKYLQLSFITSQIEGNKTPESDWEIISLGKLQEICLKGDSSENLNLLLRTYLVVGSAAEDVWIS